MSSITVVILVIFRNELSFILFNTYDYSGYILIIALFVPAAVLSSFMDGFFKGIKEISLYVKAMVASLVASLIITLILTWFFALKGAIWGISIGNAVTFIIIFFALYKYKLMPRPFTKYIKNNEVIKNVLKISAASLISGVAQQLSFLIIRKITIDNFGLFGNGIYQSIIGISLSYFGFIFSTLFIYTFPKVSGLQEKSEIVNELNDNLRYVCFLIVPLVCFLIIFKGFIIELLYSSKFAEAAFLYKYQFFGDFLKSVSWVLGIWLIPKSKIKIFLILEFILNLNYILAYYIIIQFNKNIEAVAIAYVFTYIVHLVLNFIVVKKYLDFRFLEKNFLLMVFSIFVIGTTIFFTDYLNIGLLSIPIIILWFFISLRKNEFAFIRNFLK